MEAIKLFREKDIVWATGEDPHLISFQIIMKNID